MLEHKRRIERTYNATLKSDDLEDVEVMPRSKAKNGNFRDDHENLKRAAERHRQTRRQTDTS